MKIRFVAVCATCLFLQPSGIGQTSALADSKDFYCSGYGVANTVGQDRVFHLGRDANVKEIGSVRTLTFSIAYFTYEGRLGITVEDSTDGSFMNATGSARDKVMFVKNNKDKQMMWEVVCRPAVITE